MKNLHDPFDRMFEVIYRKNYPQLVKYLFVLVHDFNIAEDLAHDIFLRIYKSRNPEITGEYLRNYLKKAARNIAIDYLKKLAREDAHNKRMIPELKEYDEAFYQSLENSVIEGEVISTVNDVLENFSESSRKIFVSRIVENKTRKQVSKEENISQYIVKMLEKEVLCKLREELKHYL